jgi:hypothetical protein
MKEQDIQDILLALLTEDSVHLGEVLAEARKIGAEDERFRTEIASENLSGSPERRGGER